MFIPILELEPYLSFLHWSYSVAVKQSDSASRFTSILVKQQFSGLSPPFQPSATAALLCQTSFPELLTRLDLGYISDCLVFVFLWTYFHRDQKQSVYRRWVFFIHRNTCKVAGGEHPCLWSFARRAFQWLIFFFSHIPIISIHFSVVQQNTLLCNYWQTG